MATRSLLSPMRLLITAAGLAVVIIGTLLLLNWWMISCGRLACDVQPAWAATEASTPDSCPPDLKSAATDTVWAKGVHDNLPGWKKRDKTVGWFFADGVTTEKLISGEGSRDNPDELWQEAKKTARRGSDSEPAQWSTASGGLTRRTQGCGVDATTQDHLRRGGHQQPRRSMR